MKKLILGMLLTNMLMADPAVASQFDKTNRNLIKCMSKLLLARTANKGQLIKLNDLLVSETDDEALLQGCQEIREFHSNEMIAKKEILSFAKDNQLSKIVGIKKRAAKKLGYCNGVGLQATVAAPVGASGGFGVSGCVTPKGRKVKGFQIVLGLAAGIGVTAGGYETKWMDIYQKKENNTTPWFIKLHHARTIDMWNTPEYPTLMSWAPGGEYLLVGLNLGQEWRNAHITVPVLPGKRDYALLNKVFFNRDY